MARPRPCVPPVTRAVRDDRSKRDQISSAGLSEGSVDPIAGSPDAHGLAWTPGPARPEGAIVDEGEPRLAVLREDLGRDAGGDQDLEVAEDLPHDEERLLANRCLRPQPLGDAVGAPRLAEQDAGDACRALAVLGEADVHEGPMRPHRRAVTGEER